MAGFPSGERRHHGIGIVGAGAIVQAAHLPAYRAAGFPVAGIFDVDRARAAAVAAEFELPKVYRGLDEMLADGSVGVVDIAVPPAYQSAIVEQTIASRKHLLCQKPLALSVAVAESLVRAAEAAGLQLAVNVNMRWEPAMRAATQLLREHRIGTVMTARFDIHYREEWLSWPWLVRSPRLLVLFDTIHILDITRKLFGEPAAVSASVGYGNCPGVAGETSARISLEYANGMTAVIDEDSTAPVDETVARFVFQGIRGRISGTLGIYYNYPAGRPDTLLLTSQDTGVASETTFTERWIPDAFRWTMHELLRALETNTTPENSGADHVKTLKLIDRIYASAASEAVPEESR